MKDIYIFVYLLVGFGFVMAVAVCALWTEPALAVSVSVLAVGMISAMIMRLIWLIKKYKRGGEK